MPEVADSILKREVSATNGSGSSAMGPWLHVTVFLASALLIVSHRPEAITNPQFWAEDGVLWYAQAHNLGWREVLFQPVAGYLCTLPRLTAALAQLLPLAAGPLLFNAVAIFVQVLTVSFFLSSRFHSLGRLPTRLLFGFLYLALPNSFEVTANITNTQWHLAILLCLVAIAEPATSAWWRCFDIAVIVLASLTGPFAILLWPLAVLVWGWKRRNRWTLTLLFTLTACVLIQLGTLLRTGNAARVHGSLGANPLLFARLLASRVFLAALVGRNNLSDGHSHTFEVVLITVAGILVLLYSLLKAPWELKLFTAFASLALAAALLNPMAPPPKWPALLNPWCTRYWLLPMLAFVAGLLWIAGEGHPKGIRLAAVAALVFMSVGIVRDWKHPRFTDMHFGVYAQQYSDLPKGSALTIPLNPPGWSMTLTKR